MTYSTDLKAIFDGLISTIIATSSFTSTNTTGAYIKSWEGVTYPVCMVRPTRDRLAFKEIGGAIEQREVSFKVIIKNDGTGIQDDQDSIMDLAGEVIDQIRSSPNLGVTTFKVEAEDQEIDYSMSETPSAIFYYAVLTVRVLYLPNI